MPKDSHRMPQTSPKVNHAYHFGLSTHPGRSCTGSLRAKEMTWTNGGRTSRPFSVSSSIRPFRRKPTNHSRRASPPLVSPSGLALAFQRIRGSFTGFCSAPGARASVLVNLVPNGLRLEKSENAYCFHELFGPCRHGRLEARVSTG